MLTECVINISEGRDRELIRDIASRAGTALLDIHSDCDHHRSVLTIGGEADNVEDAARSVMAAATKRIDLRTHVGVHPRMGAVDVVPFIPLEPARQLEPVIEIRNRFAAWAGSELNVPCFLYGPERSLPEVRRGAFRSLDPDAGPSGPHLTAGATAVGARQLLVAYNIWITVQKGSVTDPVAALSMARAIATTIRGPALRSLGLAVGTGAQVSCNLINPRSKSVATLFDTVAGLVVTAGGDVERAELVGLLPAELVTAIPPHRWAELDLSPERTIEARLASAGAPTGW